MIQKHLYLKICCIFVASLAGFAVLATLAWSLVGEDDFNADLFLKSAGLAEMLVAPTDQSVDIQQDTLLEIHHKLDFDLSLFAADGTLVANAGPPAMLQTGGHDVLAGSWAKAEGGTQWTTRLEDGRYLVVNLDRIALPGESTVFVVFLMAIGAGIAMVMYPFIRHLTGRLERLQLGVRQIGFGHLGARVDVEGEDEVAQLAKSFNNAAERIQTLMKSQKLLLANASHELRTPLARIRLGIELLNKGADDDRQRALGQDVDELDALIDELIAMTRIDTGVGDRDFESFDLMGLVAEECSRYSGCSFEGTATEIIGDRWMMQRALRNLIDNAFKHGEAPVTVDVQTRGRKAVLSVRDEGSGIPSDEQERVFEPFYRGPGKQNIPGSGLGLALVKKIVEAHNGSVQLGTNPESVVFLEMPLSQ